MQSNALCTAANQIQEPPLGLLEAKLDEWVNSFPIDTIREHLSDLERQKGDIEAAIESLNRRLRIWQAMHATSVGQGDLVPLPSKRDAVLTLLERDPSREFSLAEIRAMLINDGLLRNDLKAQHALEVTVSNMTKRGEIHRVRKGIYRLPDGANRTARPTNFRCKEDEDGQ